MEWLVLLVLLIDKGLGSEMWQVIYSFGAEEERWI
jgi:hypothetical protein